MLLFDNIVRTGDYRKRITIQQNRPVSKDENGRDIPRWVVFYACWAKVSRLTGRQLELALQITAEAQDLVEMRYVYGVKDDMQVLFPQPDGSVRTLDINAVIDPEERHIKTYLISKDAPEAEVS